MNSRKTSALRLGSLLLFAAGAQLCAAPSLADVLEISTDGTVATYRGPAVYTADGARSIMPVTAARSGVNRAPGAVFETIAAASERYAVSADLIEAVGWQESRLRHEAVSPKGAVGVMQLMASTAHDLGVDPHDPVQNIFGGAAYLRAMLERYGGDVSLALAAYNAGPGRVDRHGGIPPIRETQAYVAAILARLADQSLAVTDAPLPTAP